MKTVVDRLYRSPLSAALFHTTVHSLRKELAGCESILDLGCGPDSPIRHVEAPRKVGVEAFAPYVEMSRKLGIHDEYVAADLVDVEFPEKSFDAIVMIEVLEHLEKADGEVVLERLERIARKKLIVSCPNGFLEQGSHDANPYQVHRSGWTIKELTARGYTVRGMAGLRTLRKSNDLHTSMLQTNDEDIYTSIRFRPRRFWFIVAAASQIVTYYIPSLAFELMCTKELDGAPQMGSRKV